MLTKTTFLQATGEELTLPSQATQTSAKDPLLAYDGMGLAALVNSGEISAKELIEASIHRIESLDGRINAVVTRSFEQAIERATNKTHSGPFAGVPFLIKDNTDVEGLKCTHGSRFFKPNISSHSSSLISSYQEAGLNILGKSNMPEVGLLPATESDLLGACHNPWGLEHSTGGSSGGAAAAVAAGYMPFAHADDGGGSIRIPASCCGVFGLKPSRNRMLSNQLDGQRSRFIVPHCVSRSVRDSAALFNLVQDRSTTGLPPLEFITSPSTRRLTIGLCTQNYYGDEPHPDVKSAIEQTAKLCEDLGHNITVLDNPINGSEFVIRYHAAYAPELIALKKMIESSTGKPVSESGLLERFTREFIAEAMNFSVEDIKKSEDYMQILPQQFNSWMKPVDLLLTPVLKLPPVELGYLHDKTIDYPTMSRRLFDYMSYTPVQNALGMPAMSVPLGMSRKGLPIGSHFIARVGDERTLFELAYELEAAKPWTNVWAPFSATS